MPDRAIRPAIFVGSSTEGLDIARALQELLDHDADVTLWSAGVFEPGGTTLGSLMAVASVVDFAVLVATADDTAEVRGETYNVLRDNVVYELGLFTGRLGQSRTFLVFDRSAPPKLPTDLLGVSAATFQPYSSGDLVSALGAASNQIRRAIRRLGYRQERLTERIDEAARSVADTDERLSRLVDLMARSRAVELEITATMFGGLIPREKLTEIQRDLAELRRETDPQA